MNRREFLETGAALAASAVLPFSAFASPEPKKLVDMGWVGPFNLRIQHLPVRVFCLGSDNDPATSEDITAVQRWLAEHPNFSETIRKWGFDTSNRNMVCGRIPIKRTGFDHEYAKVCSTYKPDSIQCRYYEVERPGCGYLTIRIGSDNRPACEDDIKDVGRQLAKSIKDADDRISNLTIVTHHNFNMKWGDYRHASGGWRDVFIVPHDYPELWKRPDRLVPGHPEEQIGLRGPHGHSTRERYIHEVLEDRVVVVFRSDRRGSGLGVPGEQYAL